MNIEYQKLVVDFVMAIVTGVVAGLVAGWVLMGRQLHRELAAHDASRILDIVNSLEDAEVVLVQAVREALADSNRNVTALNLKPILKDARDSLFKVASQAQYLRSKRHKLLRAYLVLRIKRSPLWEMYDSQQMVGFIREIREDVIAYVAKRYAIDTFFLWFKMRFTDDEKKMLLNASRQGKPCSAVSLLQGTVPSLLFGHQMLVDELRGLVERGFLTCDTGNYSLTRKGWRVAVKLGEGSFDSKVGIMIDV